MGIAGVPRRTEAALPERRFALVRGGPKRLTVAWRFYHRHTTLTLDGVLIGAFPGFKELRRGGMFSLPDGSMLTIRMPPNWFWVGLELLRNGKPLPGSDTDPMQILRLAPPLIALGAGELGIVVTDDEWLHGAALITDVLVYSVFALAASAAVLSIIARRKHPGALLPAMGLLGIAGCLGVAAAAIAGDVVKVGVLVLIVASLVPSLARLVGAVRAVSTEACEVGGS